jgi:hypothetical protein
MMESQVVPASLAEVMGPIREAERFRRIERQRRRGIYNLLTGLPGLLFVLMFGLVPIPLSPLGIAIRLASTVLFFVVCLAPKSLLDAVRRRRPDWESSFFDAWLLTKLTDKQFWLQCAFFIAVFTVPLVLLLPLAIFEVDYGQQIIQWTVAAIALAGGVTLSIQARRLGDRLVEILTWPVALLAIPLAVVDPELFFLGMSWLGLVLVLPPVLAAVLRLTAPRRLLAR